MILKTYLLLPFLLVSESVGSELRSPPRSLVTSCTADSDCTSTQYCAAGECLEAATCKVDVDCLNPSNAFMSVDCVGYMECQEGACAKVCGPQCKDGTDWVNCFAQPCDVNVCEEDTVSCVDDYCGGCNSIHFTAAGAQVCKNDNEVDSGTINLPQTCSTDKDCAAAAIERNFGLPDASYCAQGVCMDAGSCNTELDCRNPSNVYNMIYCIGHLQCQEGMCGIECTDSAEQQCQDGSDFVTCVASPCSVNTCEGAVSCVDDYCGECNSIHLDSAGSQVCAGANTFTGTVVDTSCAVDGDCETGEYCASDDECTVFSVCQVDDDCTNPSNVFASDDCEGELECQSGQCAKVCNDEGTSDDSASNTLTLVLAATILIASTMFIAF